MGTTRCAPDSVQRLSDPLDRALLDGVPSRIVLGRRRLALVPHRRRQEDTAHPDFARHLRVRPAQSMRRHDRHASGLATSLDRAEHPVAIHFTEQPILWLLVLRQPGEQRL